MDQTRVGNLGRIRIRTKHINRESAIRDGLLVFEEGWLFEQFSKTKTSGKKGMKAEPSGKLSSKRKIYN